MNQAMRQHYSSVNRTIQSLWHPASAFLFLSFLLSSLSAQAQTKASPYDSLDRCGTVAYEKAHSKHYGKQQEGFERWIGQRIKQTRQKVRSLGMKEEGPVTIPVVVHVIHNGEESNISDEQIKSQIEVLNEDFRRTNPDASDTPGEFLPVAADIEINFTLAKQDPEGFPTNGIVKVLSSVRSWRMEDDYELKKLSFWPSEEYLNIWVVPLEGSVLGYAKFPFYKNFSGLESGEDNRLTDGVVINYKAFGSARKGSFPNLSKSYNLGRTTTHEIGHFLGLRHIWGDDDSSSDKCTQDDYCDDTPLASVSTNGCPSSQNTCGSNDMFQNYMDYTNDACMNLFTKNQKERMRAVLAAKQVPRRYSLTVSEGSKEPVPTANDLGIKTIIAPTASLCDENVTPQLLVRNYGTNTISSAKVSLKVNGVLKESKTLAMNLSPLDTMTVSFSPMTVSLSQKDTLTFQVEKTNGTADTKSRNNTREIISKVSSSLPFPFLEDFEGSSQSKWEIRNLDKSITWKLVDVPRSGKANKAFSINFFEYELAGEREMLISPALDFRNQPTVALAFDIAHANYPGKEDRLKVMVSTDCGNTFSDADVIFDQSGAGLATVDNPVSSPFVPEDREWHRKIINLVKYRGLDNVRIAFVGTNGYGNNLYIDNVLLTDEINDMGIVQVVSPSPTICSPKFTPFIEVENRGSETVTRFEATYDVNGKESRTVSFDNISLPVGERSTLPVGEIDYDYETDADTENIHRFNVSITNPNSRKDEDPTNNTASQTFTIDSRSNYLPYLESFEAYRKISQSEWTVYNPDGHKSWELHTFENGRRAVYLNSFDYPDQGEQDWLISPVLDFSQVSEARLYFNVSYALASTKRLERLKLLQSKDCGLSYTTTSYDKDGFGLSIKDAQTSWFPEDEKDWRLHTVLLKELVGESQVRLAFVATNNGGNNLFLDDIEIYMNKSPDIVKDKYFRIYPNPSTTDEIKFTFNLDERQDLEIILVDMSGREIKKMHAPNVLNQDEVKFILPKRTPDRAVPGMYMVYIKGRSINVAKKIILQ